MVRKLKALWRDQSGQSLVLFVLLLPILLGMAGLTVDVGYFYVEKQHMQSAVDSSALSGAQTLINNPDNVDQVTKEIGEDNNLNPGNMVVTSDTSQNTVKVEYSQVVPTFFMRVLNIDSRTINVSATAQASQMPGSQVFNYTIFSNEDLTMSSSTFDVKGMVHVNGKSGIYTSSSYFEQRFEAVGPLSQGGRNTFYQLVQNASPVSMPTFDINYYKNNATTVYSSSKNFSNTQLNINGIVFVNGDVTISGSSITGNGTIVATGNMTISSSSLTYSSDQNALGFFSGNGNISLSFSNATVNGFFYAPNGTINVSGSSATFNGGLIAGNGVIVSGSSMNFNYDAKIKTLLPQQKATVKLTE
ncbi:pilus assembly protein TadG-related protein [Pullulanibacillus sp. KACC 23026]|uniref:pilus assembly protein TadG-related protein n=1 Tax=Pullulanibacillus sp. KACC 23026 TaxID=3028315 RepID=UPI0023AED2D1|nr:pilus assembly protein TadG-related protein [Pullulanibacillus sp. KACC 23026]WEG13584.1 pilus assembly protein TadG-related protein [Pullulanibacillus sp. KACC 23026]